MAPSKIRKALEAVKDQTSIGLAKVSAKNTTSTDLEVAVLKTTKHDNRPADEKHVREIMTLTQHSRHYITVCVNTISRRLDKTRNWTVALKALSLVHRLLVDGDPAFQEEVFFATRSGTRLLNMADFRDKFRSDSWDFSAVVRTFALYLEERLEYKMHGWRGSRRVSSNYNGGDAIDDKSDTSAEAAAAATPVREMSTNHIFHRSQHLKQMLERFLACRPTGAAKNNRVVAAALHPLVQESYKLYNELTEIIAVLSEKLTELEVAECIKAHELFTHLSKKFDELKMFYGWCKMSGIGESSEYPEVERIAQEKLDMMDESISDKLAIAAKKVVAETTESNTEDSTTELSEIKALPAVENEGVVAEEKKEDVEDREEERETEAEKEEEGEVDFLNLKDDVVTGERHEDTLALVLFDGNVAGDGAAPPPKWVAFTDEPADWETSLVKSASNLPNQKPSLGGGLETLTLDSMYKQQPQAAVVQSGSSSSVAYGQGVLLALPAPPLAVVKMGDPFAASTMVAPPHYVQMREMEKKQRCLAEEQRMWRQYAMDGMQGQQGLARVQCNSNAYCQVMGFSGYR